MISAYRNLQQDWSHGFYSETLDEVLTTAHEHVLTHGDQPMINIICGDIGEGQREWQFEPLEAPRPVETPEPVEAPVEAPEREPVPA